MVSSLLADALGDPTKSLLDLYESSDRPGDFPQTVSRHFSQIFISPDALSEIPLLDHARPPSAYAPRSLVRFRAMVQDTSQSAGGEMYLSRLNGGRLGGWGLETLMSDDDLTGVNYADLRECAVVWAVSVPGETDWCKEAMDGEDYKGENLQASLHSIRPHKYPIPATAHVGVQVKVYDIIESDPLKPTDVLTFVGILSTESVHNELDSTTHDVPTLHALFSIRHPHTIVSRSYPAEPADSTSNSSALQTREDLIAWLAEEALGGDRDAAEWILLACIARTESRHPIHPLLPPSFLLSRFPSPPPGPSPSSSIDPGSPSTSQPTLTHLLSHILPLYTTLPLTLDRLNKERFSPESKDEDLHSGWLQLPKGSVVGVWEGGVGVGKVAEQGLNNLRALQETMSAQTLSYSFPFSAFTFPTDIVFLVLSEGHKSAFFKTDFTVQLKVNETEGSDLYKPKEAIALPPPEKLAAFRELIGGAKAGSVQVNETTSQYIQDDFVRDRQANKVTAEDLRNRMTIAKLLALSMHENSVTVDVWERTKALDERRKAGLMY